MPIGDTPHRRTPSEIKNYWPLAVGDRVMFPDYRDEAPRLLENEIRKDHDPLHRDGARPAYQDPPIIGTVREILDRRAARCHFPGVGVRDLEIAMLTRCEL
jgi:hypothetical protein